MKGRENRGKRKEVGEMEEEREGYQRNIEIERARKREDDESKKEREQEEVR